jgi:hypothetical protein
LKDRIGDNKGETVLLEEAEEAVNVGETEAVERGKSFNSA